MTDSTTSEASTFPITPAERLRAQWETVGPIVLEEFLRTWPGLFATDIAELITVDQDERWRRWEQVPAESYFSRFPDVMADRESALWVVYGEVLASIHFGNSPELAAYQTRFPFLEEELALQWEVHEALKHEFQSDEKASQVAEPPKLEPEGYEIHEEIGRGALGIVYRARHRKLGRDVALKIMREAPLMEPEAFLRFFEGARLMASLEHHRIVRVLDIGRHEGWPFISLELIEGETLADRLIGQVMSPNEAARFLLAMTEGMRFAHEHNVIHRDLKPANILIDREGQVKITDFGLAKHGSEGLAVTRSGELIGTPAYMSPEQATCASDIGPLSDLYSLGAVLYEMLTGRPPHLAPSFTETILLVTQVRPLSPNLLNILVPIDLAAVCMKCLEKDQTRRYPSARALEEDLLRYLAGLRTLAKLEGTVSKLYRWSRANPLPTALVGAVLGSIFLGFAVSSYFAYRASSGEQVALTAEKQALDALAAESRAKNRELMALRKTEQALDRSEWLVYSGILGRTYGQLVDKNYNLHHAMLIGARWDFRGPEYGLISNISRHLSKQLFGHQKAVRAVDYSPDGQTIASGSDDGTLRIWKPDFELLVDTVRVGSAKVEAVCFESGGARIAFGESSGMLKLYDLSSKQIAREWRAGSSPVRQVLEGTAADTWISLDGIGAIVLWKGEEKIRELAGANTGAKAISVDALKKRLAAIFENGSIQIWEIESGRLIQTIDGRSGPLNSVALSPDGKSVAAAGDSLLFQAWDVETATQIRLFSGHNVKVSKLRFSADGQVLAGGGVDGSVWVWDWKTGIGRLGLSSGQGTINSLAFRSGRDEISLATENSALTLFNPSQDAGVMHVPTANLDHLQTPFHPDAQSIAAPNAKGGVDLWDIKTQTLLKTLRAGDGLVHGLCFSPSGNELIGGGEDSLLWVWNVADGRLLTTIDNEASWCLSLAHHPKLPEIASVSSDGVVVTFNRDTGRRVRLFSGHKGPVVAVAYTPDGSRIVTASLDSTVSVWDRLTGWRLLEIRTPLSAIRVAVSPDGSRLITSNWTDTFDIWSLPEGQNLGKIYGHDRTVTGLAFSSDGRRIVSTSMDATVRFWNAQNLTQLLLVKVPAGLNQIAMSAGGRRVATAGGDGVLRVWDTYIDEAVASIHPNSGAVSTALFRPDGKQFLIVARYGVGQLWNADSGQMQTLLNGHLGQILTGAYSSDGQWLATGGVDGLVQLWEPESGERIATVGEKGSPIKRVSFGPKNKALAIVKDDGSLVFWDLETRKPLATSLVANILPSLDLIWSPDGEVISQVTTSGEVVNTGIDSGKEERWKAPGLHVSKVEWGLGRKVLYGMTTEGKVVVWNGETGVVERQWQAHSKGDRALSLSLDGRRLVTGGKEDVVKIWLADSGTLEYEIPCQAGEVLDVSMSPDGGRILGGFEDTTAKMIELSEPDNLKVYRR